MSESNSLPTKPLRPGRVLPIVLIYAALAKLWLVLSEQRDAGLFSDPAWNGLLGFLHAGLVAAVPLLLLYGMIHYMADPSWSMARAPSPEELAQRDFASHSEPRQQA